jgi:uncharacterized protein with ATP-grasp and redox domains
MSLAKSVTALAGADDSDLVKKAEAVTREILENARDNRLSSHQLAGQILREIKRLTGVSDPYKQFKAREMVLAPPVFFLFKVKCDPIHRFIQAPLGSFIALWKEDNSSE